MTHLRNMLHTLKGRLGDLWWYTLILFVAQRVGDVVHAFTGLWLVPKYVPQSELGAVLPLVSVGGMLGFPLIVLMMPFMKFLNKYMTQGEYGKVKRLLRDTFIATGVIFAVMLLVSRFLLPLVFERMRVEDGSLSLLIVSSGIMVALVPIFLTALQSLKKFLVLSATTMLSSFVRFGTMVVCLPIRGLSGYFAGQIVHSLFLIGVALTALRKQFSRDIKMTAYWGDDWKPILHYAKWPALLNFGGLLVVTTESFVIRRCLPDIESAGYYMISRFAEITLYFGASCVTILFPLISERYEQGKQDQQKVLAQSVLVTLALGVVFTAVIAPVTYLLFTHIPGWGDYSQFTPHLAALSIVYAIRGSVNCFVMYQLARNQFRFILFFVFIYFSEIVFLYCLTGYTFFALWLPPAWLDAMAAFNPCRLTVVLGVVLAYTIPTLLYALVSMKKALAKGGVTANNDVVL
ncbi:MAG: hypothetical protein FWG50_13340 [Kiritimatiellaeota bacterium]|nr:hypothetical protein [Kiritimatiellota bacterium]